LKLEIDVQRAAEGDLSRVQQLVERTNQFNLSTRRHSGAELLRLLSSPDCLVLAMRARDRFGEYGLTGLAILHFRSEPRIAEIDTFLMSCRVLGRRLDQAFLSEIVRRITQRWPGCPIHAEYRRTAKNGLVADFLEGHGFRPVRQAEDAVVYQFDWQRPVRRPEVVQIQVTESHTE
jgi:FkbH-like protein